MKKYLLAAAGGVILGTGIAWQFVGPLNAQEEKNERSTYEQLELFGDIFQRLRLEYVEEVDDADLIENAINGMLSSLDPHSAYLPPQDFDSMQVQTRGEFGGLGIEVTQEDGFIKVVSPIDDTPADKAGIEAGDFITHVDGETVLGLTLNEAVDLMRGEVGSKIIVTVARKGADEPFDVKIVRDVIKVAAVKARTEGDTVVLRISSFSDKTYNDLASGIEKQVKELGGHDAVNGFIVDLRNNPGGLLNQAIQVSDAFLDNGEIVSTRGRNPSDSERYNAELGDLAKGKPLIVLINGGSASASEIVAGALQDHHRAVIVGTKSFGKGSVQTVIPLQGDAAIKMTTARYYTPSGRSIQALGVAPDILVNQPMPVPEEDVSEDGDEDSAVSRQRTEADLRGSLKNDSLSEDEIKLLEAERAEQERVAKLREEDFQLAYALDLIKGMTVADNLDK